MPTIDQLRAALPGAVVTPGDEGYEAAALSFAGAGHPDVVVRPTDTDGVVAAVRWAAAEGMPIAVRGGGHGTWGLLEGGLTIDLGAFTRVEIGDGGIVRVGGGATWGAVADALAPRGLGISAGDTASVGVGGSTLGAGMGWMVRLWGLAIDQLVGAEVVTGDGRLVVTSTGRNPELFWALRGGGGNFGVVTRFDFRASPLVGVVFGAIDLDVSTVGLDTLIRAWRDAMREAPRRLTATLLDVPPMDPSAPAGLRIDLCWAGEDDDDARDAIAPLLALPGTVGSRVRRMSYPDILLETAPVAPESPGADADPGGMPSVVDGNGYLRELDDAAVAGSSRFVVMAGPAR